MPYRSATAISASPVANPAAATSPRSIANDCGWEGAGVAAGAGSESVAGGPLGAGSSRAEAASHASSEPARAASRSYSYNMLP